MRITVFFRKTFRFMQFHPRPFHYMGTRVENSTAGYSRGLALRRAVGVTPSGVPPVSLPARPLRGLKAAEGESGYLES